MKTLKKLAASAVVGLACVAFLAVPDLASLGVFVATGAGWLATWCD